MNSYELKYQDYKLIAGVDEVGRGCLLGPVVVCCIVMPKDFDYEGIDDSKRLSKKRRKQLNTHILANCLKYAIVEIDNNIIDEINILAATKLAMKQAILQVEPDVCLIDAVKLDIDVVSEAIIKGDQKSYSIACASIVAKVYRDQLLDEYSKVYPNYYLHKNKGYGTKQHILAIKEHGICKYHRKSFEPIKSLLRNN